MNETHLIGEVWKDTFSSKEPWRVQLPRGRMPCRTKRQALAIRKSIIIVHPDWFNKLPSEVAK